MARTTRVGELLASEAGRERASRQTLWRHPISETASLLEGKRRGETLRNEVERGNGRTMRRRKAPRKKKKPLLEDRGMNSERITLEVKDFSNSNVFLCWRTNQLHLKRNESIEPIPSPPSHHPVSTGSSSSALRPRDAKKEKDRKRSSPQLTQQDFHLV